ncbi:MAG: hypothetical protein EPO13_11340 [Actinomycetota bacterium]|nr:MAG: hypothetical protein EPO13_11340 [Actinomycetota bacterium]
MVSVVAFGVFFWRIDGASPWRDELVTLDMASRSTGDLWRALGNADLVHGLYYSVARGVVTAGGDLSALRGLSAAAMAATAGLLAVLGRQLGSTAVMIAAPLVLVVCPISSRYAQEARPYALATFVATAGTLALVVACRRRHYGMWIGYAACIVVLGLINILALSVLLGHLAYVAWDRHATRRWLASIGAAFLLVGPFAALATKQIGQVDWLSRPSGADLWEAISFGWTSVAGFLLLVAAVVVLAWGRSRRTATLAVTWAAAPAVALWLVSQVHPLFDVRYLVVCIPGVAMTFALIADIRLPRQVARRQVGTVIALSVTACLLVLGWSAQASVRATDGHGENVRAVASIIEKDALPGDAILYQPNNLRILNRGFGPVTIADPMLQESGAASGTLTGTEISPSRMDVALQQHNRLWVVRRFRGPALADPGDLEKARILAACYAREGSTRAGPNFAVDLYVRQSCKD